MILFFKKLWCKLFDHDCPMTFHREGVFYCWSAGSYDCICKRCGWRWENSERGAEALQRSRNKDPRTPEGEAWLKLTRKQNTK